MCGVDPSAGTVSAPFQCSQSHASERLLLPPAAQAIATDPLNWNQGTRTYSFGTGAVFDSVTLSLN